MYLVIDTETSGLTDNTRPADAANQPRLAELAMLFVNDSFELQNEYHSYVQPDGWEMQEGATAKNGLTTDFLREHGRHVMLPLSAYSAAIKEGRTVIAHNAQFDLKVMRGELRRAGLPDLFEETPNVCTMRVAQKMKIKKRDGKGWLKLTDVIDHFNLPVRKKHNAMDDALMALDCIRAMVAAGFELRPEVHHSKNYDAIQANR